MRTSPLAAAAILLAATAGLAGCGLILACAVGVVVVERRPATVPR